MSGETIEFTEAHLQATVAAYDPALHEAPIVVGHPKTDDPAYGWVKSLAYADSVAIAHPDQVDAAFAEMVRAGRFKKVSASFYAPDAPNNPKPGVYYLRHVGFLGAQPPAVKGLKSASFADGDEGVIEFGDWSDVAQVRVLRRLRDWIIGKFGLEEADKAVSGYELESIEQQVNQSIKHSPSYIEQEPQMKSLLKLLGLAETATEEQAIGAVKVRDTAFAERETAVTARETKLSTREQAVTAKEASFAERDQKAHRAELGAFLDGLIKEGKFRPAKKAEKIEFMCSLSSEATLEFGEGDKKVKKSPLDLHKEELAAGPKLVDFKEHGNKGGDIPDNDDANAIAQRALVYQEEQRKAGIVISAASAVQHVTKGAH